MKKIALEAHFITPGLEPYLLPAMPAVSDKARKHLLSLLSDQRPQHDAAGAQAAALAPELVEADASRLENSSRASSGS